MKKSIQNILTIVFLFSLQLNYSQSASDFFNKADLFFKKNVVNGKINYKSIKSNPAHLHELLNNAANIKVSKTDSKTYQAFYINAYNLAVIKGIVDKYPVKSPLNISGFFDKKQYLLGGIKTTLNGLENNLLRKVFPKESRFHFVLVCAGLGCPPIINEAYKPNTLENQLQRQTIVAINNPNFIKIKGNKARVSQIFEWYNKDFTQFGSIVEYLNKFLKEKIDPKTKVSYYTYDWTLNAL